MGRWQFPNRGREGRIWDRGRDPCGQWPKSVSEATIKENKHSTDHSTVTALLLIRSFRSNVAGIAMIHVDSPRILNAQEIPTRSMSELSVMEITPPPSPFPANTRPLAIPRRRLKYWDGSELQAYRTTIRNTAKSFNMTSPTMNAKLVPNPMTRPLVTNNPP